MLEIARKYIKAGFSVIPVKNKVPAVDWKEYQTRRATDEELQGWFPKYPQIGIVTGKISGITVVDVDVKNGGLETLKQLRLPPTWMVKTGGGGWHYYYAYDERVQQTQNVLQGIDIRNDGGQVVAPPSRHESGRKYEWTYKEGEIGTIPYELFSKHEVVKTDWEELLKLGTQEGNRNGSAASLFGKLMTLFQPKEWETVWEIGKYWNSKNNPPLQERELRNVFESISKRAITNKRQTVEEVIEQSKKPTEIAVQVKEKDKLAKRFFSWGNSELDYDLPLIEWHSYVVLFGQAGSGKTTFAMNMARANKNVCLLTLEMSRDKLVKQYAFRRAGVSKEQYKRGEYSDDIFEQYAHELDNIRILGVDEDTEKQDYSCDDIEKIVQREDVDMLFIDNFNKLAGGGENDVSKDNNTSSRLLFMTRQYNVAIVVIHHTNKPTSQRTTVLRGVKGMRGTNKLVDDADVVCELGRDVGVSRLAVYKDRDWDARGGVELIFKEGNFIQASSIVYGGIDDIAF